VDGATAVERRESWRRSFEKPAVLSAIAVIIGGLTADPDLSPRPLRPIERLPEMVRFLVEKGITSISLNPVAAAEASRR
jgi:hypothetical protein